MAAAFCRAPAGGLLDEPRPGAPRKITDANVERALTMTPELTPKDAAHWSTRFPGQGVRLEPQHNRPDVVCVVTATASG